MHFDSRSPQKAFHLSPYTLQLKINQCITFTRFPHFTTSQNAASLSCLWIIGLAHFDLSDTRGEAEEQIRLPARAFQEDLNLCEWEHLFQSIVVPLMGYCTNVLTDCHRTRVDWKVITYNFFPVLNNRKVGRKSLGHFLCSQISTAVSRKCKKTQHVDKTFWKSSLPPRASGKNIFLSTGEIYVRIRARFKSCSP